MNDSMLTPIVLISKTRNVSFESMTALYTYSGLLASLSTVYATVFMSCALLGCILNILTFCVLQVEKSFTPLYFYLKAITVISLLLNVFQLLFSFVQSRHHSSLGNSYMAQAYISYCYKPVINTLGFYKFVLNAHLTLDRIVVLRPRLKTKFSESPRLACTFTFILTVLVMSPHYLMYSPVSYVIYDESLETYSEFHVTETSDFAKTRTGVIFLNSVAAVRSVSMCLIDIILNAFTIFFFKQFMNNKSKMMNFSYNIRQSEAAVCRTRDQHQAELAESQTNSSSQSEERGTIITQTSRSNNNVELEKSVTFMVIVHCTASLAHQILLLITFFYVVTSGQVTGSAILIFVTNYVSVLRQAANFFIFYYFNKKFQKDARFLLSYCLKKT
jgi:hypothetical protein